MTTLSMRVLRVMRPAPTTDLHASPAPHATAAPLPVLLTVDEAADLLRTSRRAIYAMVERHQLPGIVRIQRRVLLRTSELLEWLDQKRAPSFKE